MLLIARISFNEAILLDCLLCTHQLASVFLQEAPELFLLPSVLHEGLHQVYAAIDALRIRDGQPIVSSLPPEW